MIAVTVSYLPTAEPDAMQLEIALPRLMYFANHVSRSSKPSSACYCTFCSEAFAVPGDRQCRAGCKKGSLSWLTLFPVEQSFAPPRVEREPLLNPHDNLTSFEPSRTKKLRQYPAIASLHINLVAQASPPSALSRWLTCWPNGSTSPSPRFKVRANGSRLLCERLQHANTAQLPPLRSYSTHCSGSKQSTRG